MVLVPEPMGNKQFFGLCAFTRSWEGLKLCQNVARVSPGGVKGLDLGLGMFTYLAPCMVSVASSPCSDPQTHGFFFWASIDLIPQISANFSILKSLAHTMQ